MSESHTERLVLLSHQLRVRNQEDLVKWQNLRRERIWSSVEMKGKRDLFLCRC